MANGDNVLAQIPAVWFDVYARVFPGLYIVFGTYFLTEQPMGPLSWDKTFVLILLSYVAGHALQPINSYVAWQVLFGKRTIASRFLLWLRPCIGSAIARPKVEPNLNAEFERRYSADTREYTILSKQRAECVSMVAFATSSVLLAAIMTAKRMSLDLSPACPEFCRFLKSHYSVGCILLGSASIVFLLLAWERVSEVRRRTKFYIDRQRKKICPDCACSIKTEARTCRNCNREFWTPRPGPGPAGQQGGEAEENSEQRDQA